jgi:16S rRNA (cytosine967-C5)-methyltransferase
VCTLTDEESVAVDDHLATTHPAWTALPPPGDPWQPVGRGARLLPQAAGTDGMYVLRLRAPAS